jgi:predicted CXXCH cytochrome family protein
MKRLIIVAMVLALVAGFSTGAFAVISGSAHDLSGLSLGTDELCKYCHIPHNPTGTSADYPLWNRANTAETFTLYDGTTGATVTGSSARCLSCHDNATGVGAYQGNTDSTLISAAIPAALSSADGNIGTDLTDDHPIGTAAIMDDATGMVGSTPTTLTLESGQVECGVCHDPHNDDTNGFLAMSNAGSALCLDCHAK